MWGMRGKEGKEVEVGDDENVKGGGEKRKVRCEGMRGGDEGKRGGSN